MRNLQKKLFHSCHFDILRPYHCKLIAKKCQLIFVEQFQEPAVVLVYHFDKVRRPLVINSQNKF